MSISKDARRDLAVIAIHNARRQHDAVRALVGRRLAHDLGARQMATVLGVVEPLLVAVENLVLIALEGIAPEPPP